METDSTLSLISREKDFCEVRMEQISFSNIRFKDGNFQANSGTEEGASIRVFRNRSERAHV